MTCRSILFTNELFFCLQEQNNKPAAPTTDDAPPQGHQIKTDAEESIEVAHREENERSWREPDSSNGGVVAAVEEEEGGDGESVMTKLRKMVNRTPQSLALDNLPEDGVHQRPCENGRDLSPDRNDSDSVSAYEDASAETPELEDASELDEDKEDVDGDTKDPDTCILS